MTDAPKIIQMENGVWRLEGEQLWDTTILPVCLEHIKEGDTVIDAGAWIGGHAMAYAEKVGAKGRVVSIEPNPLAYECLVRNTESYQNVICVQAALGDTFCSTSFSLDRGWYDSGHVGKDHKVGLVLMKPLDDYDLSLSPNFIKIDVEGCELKMLKGAVKTIEKSRPVMVVEINKPALKRQGDDYTQILSWLLKYRYVMHPIEKDVTTDTEIYNILAFPA